MTGPLAFAAWHGYYFSRQYTSMNSMVKALRLGSAPARLPRLLKARLTALAGPAPPGERPNPPGAQPLPRVLELAASEVADFATAFGHAGMNIVLNLLHSFRSRFLRRDIGRF